MRSDGENEQVSAEIVHLSDCGYGIVRSMLLANQDTHPCQTLDDFVGRHRTDHIPHLVQHAVKAMLQAGYTRAETLRQYAQAMADYEEEHDEDHLGASATRAVLASRREEYLANLERQSGT